MCESTWGDVWASKPPGEKQYCGSKYVSLLIKRIERSCRGLGRVLQAVGYSSTSNTSAAPVFHTAAEVLEFRGGFCVLS